MWRKKGPLGKLHNTVIYIAGSNQRLERFLLFSKGLKLLRDNDTRWNSWYRMLERALKLRDAITQFHNLERMEEDSLSNEEWEQLALLRDFLKAYSQATLACEGHYATVERILPIMEFLLDTLEKGKEKYVQDPFIGPCTKDGWAKLEKYYKKSDETSAYVAAVVMCPNRKWKFFEKVGWKPQWIRDAQKQVRENMWKKYYKPADIPSTVLNTSKPDKEKSLFEDWEERTLDTATMLDEYEQYVEADVLVPNREPNREDNKAFNPFDWWLEPTQQRQYPNLSKMALDLLSCPAMSAEVERLFSSCKITISERRMNLGVESVEAIECLKSWLQNDNISFVDSDLDTVFRKRREEE